MYNAFARNPGATSRRRMRTRVCGVWVGDMRVCDVRVCNVRVDDERVCGAHVRGRTHAFPAAGPRDGALHAADAARKIQAQAPRT
ncbi:hypothetical protein BMMON2_18630 [Burkholderia mallei]|nr:hypothetical protein BpKM391_41940 [Burkholderia pseudomallei]